LRLSKAPLTIALAGNPNSGKTSIFNHLTGANQHVGNYPGVTVEKKQGRLNFKGHHIAVVDLPGTYSLSAHSIEEIVARHYIINDKPDAILNIVDASNLERNLFLTTQLMEFNVPVIIALNMSDMAHSRGMEIDREKLSRLLGVAVVPTVGHKGKGLDELVQQALDTINNPKGYHPAQVNYGRELEHELGSLAHALEFDKSLLNGYEPRWTALKLLENDNEIREMVGFSAPGQKITEAAEDARRKLQSLFGDEPASIISDRRYGFISGACSEAVALTEHHRHNVSDTIDLLLIHPVLGLPIFGVLIWMMFNLTFSLGEKPVEWIEVGVSFLGRAAERILPGGILADMIVDGIIPGVGGVLVFLPNIMILFFCIALLEDTGYMARAAFVMDRLMHRIGLHGKSFIPMVIGFGCSGPAYMTARILEDKSDRLITMHVTSFMSCGARLPIYILVCGAFWPVHAGNVVFSIYLLGIVVAIATVKLLRASRFRGMSADFIMELPPYRIPTARSLLIHMWERARVYLQKAGTMILAASIIIWFLMTFPQKNKFDTDYDSLINQTETTALAGEISDTEKNRLIAQYEGQREAERIEFSFVGRLGRLIEPAIKPLGFDWRLGIALISGFAAKEVVVSTMGTIYGVSDNEAESGSLRRKLAEDPQYSKLIAYAFLVFVLLYIPCMAAMVVFLRETGSWKEVGYQLLYTTSWAYVLALIVYQGGKILGLG